MSSDHLSRQLRFVVPGACITLWLRTPSLIARIWAEATPFARFVSVCDVLSVTLIFSLLLFTGYWSARQHCRAC